MALGTKTMGAVTLTRTYSTRALGRKRVVTDEPVAMEEAVPVCCRALVDKRNNGNGCAGGRKKRASLADADQPCYINMLPQDLLVRIICGVYHSDLPQLKLVSKAVREATLIAKKTHFAFSTPMCKPAFRRGLFPEDDAEGVDDDDDQAPNAPRMSRKFESKIEGKRIDSLAVALFAGEFEEDDDHLWSHQDSMLIDL